MLFQQGLNTVQLLHIQCPLYLYTGPPILNFSRTNGNKTYKHPEPYTALDPELQALHL